MKDLTTQKFSRLRVLGFSHKSDAGQYYWKCQCDCGNFVTVTSGNLKSGHTSSCGCLRKEVAKILSTKHGHSTSRLYITWENIKDRCSNPQNKRHASYYDRHITICEEWKNNFEAFYIWAIKNGYSENLTIDRIDNNKGYTPDNCRWVSQKIQQRNRRNNHYITYNNETHCMSEWCEILGLKYGTICSRINRNWDIERAFTTP